MVIFVFLVCFTKNGMTQRNPKKNLTKESWQRTSGTIKRDKLGQVGVVGQVGQGEWGLLILVGQVEQGEWDLQIFVGQVGQGQGVCPLEPFHLSQMGLQGREIFQYFDLLSVFEKRIRLYVVTEVLYLILRVRTRYL